MSIFIDGDKIYRDGELVTDEDDLTVIRTSQERVKIRRDNRLRAREASQRGDKAVLQPLPKTDKTDTKSVTTDDQE